MRLILVRHPKPRCEEGPCYGRLDLECDGEALEAAVPGFRQLARGHRLYTSPARRARDLAERLGAAVIVKPRLQELHFGDWEGRRWQDLGREPVEAWQRGLPNSAPPNGETLAELGARCADWVSGLEPGGGPVLAITHAGPIRVICALLKGEPLLTYFKTSVPFAKPLTLAVENSVVNLTQPKTN
jgi:alpha-ribazole phosphatase